MFEFLKRLFSLNADTYSRKRAGFRLLNVEEEAVKMSLVHHGRKDGARDVPATDDLRPGTVESQVIELGKNMMQENLQHYEQEFHSYAARLAALTPEGMLSGARMQTQGIFSSMAALPQQHAAKLRELRENVVRVQKELKLFRHDNGLEERAAHYPDSKILHVSFLVFLLLVESFLNATFLAQGSELGLLGGWTEAILISLINAVAFGYALSWSVCQSFRYQFKWKFLGVTLLLIIGCIAIAFNLCVAHYRNALAGATPEMAGAIAWDMFKASPWELGDFKSALMLLFGVVVVLLAMIDWMLMDDKYPGYGRIYRKQIEELGEHAQFHHWLVHDQLQGLRDDANEVISKHMKIAAQAASEDAQTIARMLKLNERLQDSAENIQNGVNRLLQIYREANRASRDTEPPTFFQTEWRYERGIFLRPIPEEREMPPIEVFTAVLDPLQQELSKTYRESLNILNEMNE